MLEERMGSVVRLKSGRTAGNIDIPVPVMSITSALSVFSAAVAAAPARCADAGGQLVDAHTLHQPHGDVSMTD